MTNISITLNNSEKEDVYNKLLNYEVNTENQIIEHLFKFQGHTITLYKTNVMVIQGKNAETIYYKIFEKQYTSTDYNQIDIFQDNKEVNQYYISTVGCDEVGVGDFFGGLCVCATYVNKTVVKYLKSIGVRDSKKLTDDKMIELFDQFKDHVTFVAYNIDANEYNRLFDEYQNSHIIKTVLHNQCLWDLSKKINRPYFVIMDQYVSKDKYCQYLDNIGITPFNIDIFTTQAEDQYIAVACASIISRVLFLDAHKKLCAAYQVNFPLGSSNDNIKNVAKYIIRNYGLDALRGLCKNHFKTYDEILKAG